MSQPNAQAVIWDVDGTLVDTAELHFQAWCTLCAELDRPFTRADFAATFGRRNPEILQHLFGNRFAADEIAVLGERKEKLYRAAARAGVQLLPGVRPLLEALHLEGIRQAIGSSAPLANIDLILDATGSRGFFDGISSSEDTTRGKPDPQVFLVAARKVEVAPSQCVVVEDAPAGVQGARAGGMKCIAVTFVGHHSEATLRSAGANLVVPTLETVSAQTIRKLLE